MEQYLPYFPEEIQVHIRNELPSYAKLNKKEYSGINNLRYLCYKDISKNEFISYIQEYQPKYFPIFSMEENGYVIYDHIKNEGYYEIITHTVSTDNKSRIEVSTDASYSKDNIINVDEIYDYIMSFDNIEYDIISIYNIISIMRKECRNIKSIITYMLNKHIRMDDGNNDLEITLNKIKTCLYIVSCSEILKNRAYGLRIFIVPLKISANKAEFTNKANYNPSSYYLEKYLKMIYDQERPTIDIFLDTLPSI